MRNISKQQLDKIIDNHKLWLQSNGEKGECANLSYADLSYADLSSANLRCANLRCADLYSANLRSANLTSADLSYANLSYANLTFANLRCANLRCADLYSANLSYANLTFANLRFADLRSADLDFSAFPLWCGGLDVHIDDRQATQLLYHLLRNIKYSKNTSAKLKRICKLKSLVKQANKFHRVEECGEIEIEGFIEELKEKYTKGGE